VPQTLPMPRAPITKFRVRTICGDPIEPGTEGRVTSERLDLPAHCAEGVLGDLLGVRAVAGDAHRQAVDAISVPRDQRLEGPGLVPAQRFHQICVGIHDPSRVTERQLSHCDFLPCGMVLSLTRLYRGTVTGSSPAPWKMAYPW